MLTSARGADYYVATNGAAGPGSLGSPWTPEVYATNTILSPGDTIWWRGGTYTNSNGSARLINITGKSGTPSLNITNRAYPGENPIIGGSFSLNVSNVMLRGITIRNFVQAQTRTNLNSAFPGGVNLYQGGNKVHLCYIRDCGQPGIGVWANDNTGTEIVGNVVERNGLYDTEFSYNAWRSSGMYIQSSNGAPLIEGNIVLRQSTTLMKAYTQGGYANNIKFRRNIGLLSADQGFELDSQTVPQTGIEITSNVLFRAWFSRIGVGLTNGADVVIRDNYFGHQQHPAIAMYKDWVDFRCYNNTFVQVDRTWYWGGTDIENMRIWDKGGFSTLLLLSNNTYMGGQVGGSAKGWYRNGTNYTWAQWQAAGLDATSTWTSNMPVANVVKFFPIAQERGRAHMAIFNWAGSSSQSVDISSSGLVNGESYAIYDAENYDGSPIATGTYSSGAPTISVPLQLTTVSTKVGFLPLLNDWGMETSHATNFAAYVLKLAASGAPVISSVVVASTNDTTATITWTTDAASDSTIILNGITGVIDTNLVTSHSYALSGLAPATTYLYQVQSSNSGGTNASTLSSFVTRAVSTPALTNIASIAPLTVLQNPTATISQGGKKSKTSIIFR